MKQIGVVVLVPHGDVAGGPMRCVWCGVVVAAEGINSHLEWHAWIRAVLR